MLGGVKARFAFTLTPPAHNERLEVSGRRALSLVLDLPLRRGPNTGLLFHGCWRRLHMCFALPNPRFDITLGSIFQNCHTFQIRCPRLEVAILLVITLLVGDLVNGANQRHTFEPRFEASYALSPAH